MLRTSLLLDPSKPDWFLSAISAALGGGAGDAALEFAAAGVARYPKLALLHFFHGHTLKLFGRSAESVVAFRRALELEPGRTEVLPGLGSALWFSGQYDESLVILNDVVARNPDNASDLLALLALLYNLERYDEARGRLREFKGNIMDHPFLRQVLSAIELFDGNYKSGFELFRADARADFDFPLPFRRRHPPIGPVLDNLGDAAGKHILVLRDDGFGDDIQFVRYVPMLADVAGRVTLDMPRELHRLFAGIDQRVRIIADRAEAGSYDLECPLLHLPFLFGTELDTIPARLPYLSVPDAAIAQRRLPELSPGANMRVGLCWAGRPWGVGDRRSIPFDQIAPLLDIAGIDFYSLQLGPATQEMQVPGGHRCRVVLDSSFDYYDTAAIVMQLDLVIAVDTSVCHLAAGLGKPTWIMNRFGGCWRWLRDREDSPWYPTVRLFRQPSMGDWASVIAQVGRALRMSDEWTSWASQLAREADYIGLRKRHLQHLPDAELRKIWVETLRKLVQIWAQASNDLLLEQLFADVDFGASTKKPATAGGRSRADIGVAFSQHSARQS